METKVKWSVAEAKQRLSELLRTAAEEPQTILSRSRPVAAVVDMKTFEEFKAWREGRLSRTIADAFGELRSLSEPTGYRLRLPGRKNRRSGFPAPKK